MPNKREHVQNKPSLKKAKAVPVPEPSSTRLMSDQPVGTRQDITAEYIIRMAIHLGQVMSTEKKTEFLMTIITHFAAPMTMLEKATLMRRMTEAAITITPETQFALLPAAVAAGFYRRVG